MMAMKLAAPSKDEGIRQQWLTASTTKAGKSCLFKIFVLSKNTLFKQYSVTEQKEEWKCFQIKIRLVSRMYIKGPV